MTDRLFWDTNVLLDLLGDRDPFYEDSAKIATLAYQKKLKIFVSTVSYINVYYVLSKYESSKVARQKLRKFTALCTLVDVEAEMIWQALDGDFKDFEDEVQYLGALKSDCTVLITRNERDFRKSTISVMNQREYLSSLQLI